MVKISVIMPVYNTEKYVGEAIESILNQDFQDFEFIIIDDCSTDYSYKICEEYAMKDDRIKLSRNEKNMGISFTRNKLIELTNTNYIASQDSDDISELNRLELGYDFLEHNPDYTIVSGNNTIINEDGDEIGFRKYSDDIKNVILKKSPIAQPSSMFKKDIFYKVGGYDNNVHYGLEDYDLWLRFFINGYKIKNLNIPLLKYRIREGQCKSNIKQVIKTTIETQKKAINKYGYKQSFSDYLYITLEQILLLLPNKVIFYLFNLIEYRGKKY